MQLSWRPESYMSWSTNESYCSTSQCWSFQPIMQSHSWLFFMLVYLSHPTQHQYGSSQPSSLSPSTICGLYHCVCGFYKFGSLTQLKKTSSLFIEYLQWEQSPFCVVFTGYSLLVWLSSWYKIPVWYASIVTTLSSLSLSFITITTIVLIINHHHQW